MPTTKFFAWLEKGHRKRDKASVPTQAVPHSQAPKSRPPKTIRDVLMHSLPQYSGPYTVGIMEIEIPVAAPRSFGPMKRAGKHALTLETVLFNVYYPAAFGTSMLSDPPGEHHAWSRATWLPRPRKLSSEGYAKFGKIPSGLMVPFFAVTAWMTKIPAFRNAQVAEYWPPKYNVNKGGEGMKAEAGERPEELPEGSKPSFPLLFFSHGLGGSRSVYSSVCGEFASYGFVVVAMEHRDGSGSRTIVNYGPESNYMWEEVLAEHKAPPAPPKPENPHFYDADKEKAKKVGDKPKPATKEAVSNSKFSLKVSRACYKAHIKHPRADKGRTYRTIDYIWPKYNKYDTEPGEKVDAELRQCQINMRKAEVAEVYNLILAINDGDGEAIAKLNLKKKGAAGGSSRGLEGVDWASWKGRIAVRNVTVAGHSFGAASTIEILRHSEQMFPKGLDALQGIIYDPWGAAIQDSDSCEHRIKAPLLGINSEAFMHWTDNFSMVMKVFQEACENNDNCWMMTVKGTIHISQSDFTLIYPRLCSFFLGMSVDPARAMDININASLEFLRKVMPPDVSQWNRGEEEGLLDVRVLSFDDEDRFEKRPSRKHIGKMLRIQNDAKGQLEAHIPATIRRLRRAKAKGDGTRNAEDEIWMHIKPGHNEDVKAGVPLDIIRGNREFDGGSIITVGTGGQLVDKTENPKANKQTMNN